MILAPSPSTADWNWNTVFSFDGLKMTFAIFKKEQIQHVRVRRGPETALDELGIVLRLADYSAYVNFQIQTTVENGYEEDHLRPFGSASPSSDSTSQSSVNQTPNGTWDPSLPSTSNGASRSSFAPIRQPQLTNASTNTSNQDRVDRELDQQHSGEENLDDGSQFNQQPTPVSVLVTPHQQPAKPVEPGEPILRVKLENSTANEDQSSFASTLNPNRPEPEPSSSWGSSIGK
jgi:hypothetical protein